MNKSEIMQLFLEKEQAENKTYEFEKQIKDFFKDKFNTFSVSMLGERDIELHMEFGHFNFEDEKEFIEEMKSLGFKLQSIYDTKTHGDHEKGLYLNFILEEVRP